MNERELMDPFRHLHGETRKYTRKRLSSLQRGRLDFFLTTKSLIPFLRNCDIDISYKSDHSIIVLELLFSNQIHGKGYWKFNNSLLNDIEYVDLINEKINNVILQYSLPVYNGEHIINIDRSELQFIIDDQLFMETLLMEIRGETISFSSYKTKAKNQGEKHIENEISFLETNLNETNKDRLSSLQSELENLRKEKLHGSFIRSRANWADSGEKVTKYFCNLEKQNIASETIPLIETEDGNHLFDQREILKEAKHYYETLYNESNYLIDVNLEDDLKNCTSSKLDEK